MQLLEGKEIVKEFPGRTERLGLYRSKVTAVDRVSIGIDPGRTLGIVGESGSGKSTLGEILGDLQRPTSGTVLYKGVDIRSLRKAGYRAFRRSVQFVFQSPKESMNPYFTILKTLIEPMKVLLDDFEPTLARREALLILERVGLQTSLANRYPSELSGGQCQRVAIARALLPKPEIVICDECVSALDVSVQAQILNLLKDLQNELGTAYLFISHDMGVINYMAHEIAVMSKGKIVERGERQAVLSAPMDEYSKTLIASSSWGE